MTVLSRWLRLIPIAAVAVSAAACGARFYAPPSGAGVPATDAPAVAGDATSNCARIQTFQASMRLSARGLPNLNVRTGVTANQLLLQVGATAAPDIWLAGSADQATLLLREGNRVVRARAEDIVDALIGVKMAPQQFMALLTGCVARDLNVTSATAFNGTRRLVTPDAELFAEQIAGAWRIVAGSFGNVRVDYRPLTTTFPARARVRARLAGGRDVAFTLDVQESLPDRPIPEQSFQLAVPTDADPMTLDDLRRMFSGR